jgi:hypothetical protein
MTDEKTYAEVKAKASWLQRQLVGTAMIAGATAAGGAVWHLIKKRPLPSGIKGGALLGVIASIGFAGDVYDSVFSDKTKSFVDSINEERARTNSAGQQR